MHYVDGLHGLEPSRTDAAFATAVPLTWAPARGSTWAAAVRGGCSMPGCTPSANSPHQDTALAYLQLVLRQAAKEFPAALAEWTTPGSVVCRLRRVGRPGSPSGHMACRVDTVQFAGVLGQAAGRNGHVSSFQYPVPVLYVQGFQHGSHQTGLAAGTGRNTVHRPFVANLFPYVVIAVQLCGPCLILIYQVQPLRVAGINSHVAHSIIGACEKSRQKQMSWHGFKHCFPLVTTQHPCRNQTIN